MAEKTLRLVGGNRAPVPPRRLGKPGRELWELVHGQYQIVDAGGLEMLAQACEATDMLSLLTAQVEQDGPVIKVKGAGLRDHPALRHIIAHRAFVVRTLARLGLDVEAVRPVGRPAGTFSKG
jgi:hypothetical protein